MGRISILTEELIKEICVYVENGNTYINAINLSNISESIFYEWKKRGEEDFKKGAETIFTKFLESIKRAKAKFKAFHVQQIMKASKIPKHWTASAWLLERIFPEEFAKRQPQQIEHTGKIDVENKGANIEELQNENRIAAVIKILTESGVLNAESEKITDPETD